MNIKNVRDIDFKPYGRVLADIAAGDILKAMESTPIPEEVIYVAKDEQLQAVSDFAKLMENSVYGGSKVQIGYCNGHNQKLNALEYHRASEINVAATDLILLLGRQQDIEADFTYDTSKVEAFLVPAGTVLEIYATTLHYAPCGIDGAGFRCVVVLPEGTNYEVETPLATKEDKLLAAVNKWLIAHEEAHIEGAFAGLKGKNIEV